MIEIPPRSSIEIVVVSAHTVVRAGLKSLLDNCGNLIIIDDASDTAEALTLVRLKRPDVTVIDPDSEEVTLNAIAELTAAGAERILVLTAETDPRLHQRAFEFGAVGVVMKTHPVETLVRAIEKVHLGEVWLDRVKTANLLNGILRRRDPDRDKIMTLTRREREVIAIVGEGLKNAAIGERLFISESTVRNHLTSILGKLELADRFELAVYAFRHGLVEPTTREPSHVKSARLAGPSRIPVRQAGGY
jgi:DNA-binding NarL/FixJ family response regulator